MSIQIEQIDLLHRVMQLEANVHIRNAIVSVIDRIRMPMSEILALVPGESAAARSRAIGISRQTYYAWVREENRPLTDQAEHLARITGVPANLISARSYLESANDAGGEVAEAPARVAQDGADVPRRGKRVRREGDRRPPGRGREARQRGAVGSGTQQGLGGSPGEVRGKPRRRSSREKLAEIAACD